LELERQSRDWPSEYHLTRRGAWLLRGFRFNPSASVLEDGCGCGAITRLLGESFARVVAVEGSHSRARLARLRARDMAHVAVVCSPFEKIEFRTQFDIVFCIGVLEYAGVFVDTDDPYEETLERFARLLRPKGELVLAIENQFGLKYLASSAEDHTGVMFDSIQGYASRPGGPRTFGRAELEDRLRKRFPAMRFHYPLPDYRSSSRIVSEEMVERVDVASLFGSYRSTDSGHPGRKRLFSEELAWREVSKNRTVPWFANSFLVIAAKGGASAVASDGLGRGTAARGRRGAGALLLPAGASALSRAEPRVAGGSDVESHRGRGPAARRAPDLAGRLARLESEFLLRSSVGPVPPGRRRFWAVVDLLPVFAPKKLERDRPRRRVRGLLKRGLRRRRPALGGRR
jgi:SAM-dependent methyltransferase